MLNTRFLSPFCCGSNGRRTHPKTAQSLRMLAMRIVKSPLLERYVVDWHWPRTADRGIWEELSIASRSGATLAGLYATGNGRRKGVVICAHPLRRDAKSFFLSSGRADVFLRNGYDVLLFDFNGFGASSHGDFNYVQDLLAAAAYARQRAAGLPVHALAACFGAVWTMCAAMYDHPFCAIVVEAPITSLPEYFAESPIARAFLRVLWRLFPRTAAGATPIEAAARLAGTPRLLIIGGIDDTITPIEMSRRLYETCTLPRSARAVWYVERAGHLRAFEVAPREYEERVIDFLTTAADRSGFGRTTSDDVTPVSEIVGECQATIRSRWEVDDERSLRIRWQVNVRPHGQC